MAGAALEIKPLKCCRHLGPWPEKRNGFIASAVVVGQSGGGVVLELADMPPGFRYINDLLPIPDWLRSLTGLKTQTEDWCAAAR